MTTTETGWPYDADRDDPLTKLRIPAVSTSHPHWCYIVAFDTSSPERRWAEWKATHPDVFPAVGDA